MILVVNSILILLMSLIVASCYILGLDDFKIIAVGCMTFSFLQLPLIAVLLSVSLCNFRAIVRRYERLRLNTCQLVLHAIFIILFTIDVGVLFYLTVWWDASISNF